MSIAGLGYFVILITLTLRNFLAQRQIRRESLEDENDSRLKEELEAEAENSGGDDGRDNGEVAAEPLY